MSRLSEPTASATRRRSAAARFHDLEDPAVEALGTQQLEVDGARRQVDFDHSVADIFGAVGVDRRHAAVTLVTPFLNEA
ncbi:MAG: hypothetical protein IH849_02475 [Acidobacteria bacterium]|nr:hypothetical protein [Acidobacteriota bacterium]